MRRINKNNLQKSPGGLQKTLASISGPIICIFVAIVLLVFVEYYCRKFLPEFSDSYVFKIQNFKEKYHHPLILSEKLAKPDPEAFRIIFLGDSFTYGFCDAEYSFPHLVQEYFQKGLVQGVSVRKIQVFNLGRVSYSPSIYGVVLRDFAPRIKPYLVVIAVDDSDPQDDYIYRKMLVRDQNGLPVSVYPDLLGVPQSLKPLARELKVIRLFCGILATIKPPPPDPDDYYIGKLVNRYGHYGSKDIARWASAFSRSLELVDAMVNYCRLHGIKVALVNYPYAPVVTTKYGIQWRIMFGLDAHQIYEPVFHSLQKEYAMSRGIPYYDFTNFLCRLSDLEGIYNEEDGHFSAQGNMLFAQELVRFINQSFFSKK